jgi:hypothetical protein
MIEIVEFPLHVMDGSLVRAVDDAIKELPDNARLTAPLFVNVNMVGCLHAKHPKVRRAAADTYLREDVIAQIPVEGILLGKMSKIFHESSIRSLNIVLITY